jgi:hypothetical protein
MNNLAKEGLLENVGKIYLSTYEYFLAGKTIRKPFRKGIRVGFPLQLIYSDIYGPINVRVR